MLNLEKDPFKQQIILVVEALEALESSVSIIQAN